ncbi:MAG TPA: hypothetical protein PLQ97_14260 [Myxococcota bacterium]|nr:hypothetical protein [Myxococcota bacterium]HQK52432.1 hypothetical protein [Myxococcota bacterium]
MWVEDLEDLHVDQEQDGEVVVREEGRVVLSRGTRPLVCFRFRRRGADGEFGSPMLALVRLRKAHGGYQPEGRLNLSWEEATELAVRLEAWKAPSDP